jgi:membrane-associated phospholipid phosphatase
VGDGTSTSTSLLKALVWVDSNKNCLPSLHASLTLISVWALWQPRRMLQNTLYVLWAVFIIFSIVQLRRHLSLDVGAGLLVGFMAIILLNLTVVKAKISHKN